MSKRAYRPTPGALGEDVIYNRRPLWLIWLPNWMKYTGWHPYANAASARNNAVRELNKTAEKLEKQVRLYAEHEAQVQADCKDLDRFKYDEYSVGKVIMMSDKQVAPMRPYVPNTPPTFLKMVNKAWLNDILKKAKVSGSPLDKSPGKRNGGPPPASDMMYTSKDGLDSAVKNKHAEHVVAYSADKEKKNSKGSGKDPDENQKRQKLINNLKNVFPKQDQENKQEWNIRLGDILDEQEGGS